MNYILIIITGIIALIGTTMKTKDDKNAKHFVKLHTGGKILLLLLGLSITFSIINQRNQNQSARDEKLASNNKTIQDSLIAANRFLLDSIGFSQTITGLKKQREFDSLQLVKDSSHFLTTLNKFNQQLNAQKTALENLGNILNPLFPLNTICTFEIELDSLNPDKKNELNNISKGLKRTNRYHSNFPNDFLFNLEKDTLIGFFHGFIAESTSYDSLFVSYDESYQKLYEFIKSITPYFINVQFLNQTARYRNLADLQFMIEPKRYEYSFLGLRKKLIIRWNENIDANSVTTYVQNVNQCANDSLIVEMKGAEGMKELKCTNLTLNLGDNYFKSYPIFPELQMKKHVEILNDRTVATTYRLKL